MLGVSVVAAVGLACVASVGAVGSAGANSGAGCHVPSVRGLTFQAARLAATHAGCKLRVKGARVEQGYVQTVARQSPVAGRRGSVVTVWLSPLCIREADYAPEIKEPAVRAGPTELVSGFYLVGGPPSRRFSSPQCRLPEPPPGPGTVEVVDGSGTVVATKTSVRGQFVEIPLQAGSYTIRGIFLNATVNGVHPTRTESLVIPADHTVRQDFFLSIP
jgi:hypothetical protein